MLFGALYAIVDTEYRLLRQIMQHLKATTYCALIASDLEEIPGKYVPEASSRSFCILLRKLEFVPDEYQKSVYIIWTKKKDMVSQSNLDNYNRISLYIFNKFLQKDWISPVHKVGLISKSFCKPNHYSEHYRLKEKMLSRVVIWHIFWRMEPK